MLKKSSIAVMLLLLATGCSREVYLQPVPCVADCPKCPCFLGTTECCPEDEMQPELQTYQVYDVPSEPTTYDANATDKVIKRRCKTTCRHVPVQK